MPAHPPPQGHGDIAIGSRLPPGAQLTRGPKRELISRSYNLLPVRWVDDPDSRVDIVATAREDLRGIRRLRAAAVVDSSQDPTASGSDSRSWRSPSTVATRGSRTLTATPMAARTRAAAIQKAR